MEMRCNGIDDCEDGYRTDECNCVGTYFCLTTFKCISNTSLCDGVDDCGDKSDEVIQDFSWETVDRSKGGGGMIHIDILAAILI